MEIFKMDKTKGTYYCSADKFEGLNQVAPFLSGDLSKYTVFPGFCDVHVHFREPGFSYKETIFAGSRAAAHGGYTAVCTMPNLNPPPDSKENLKKQTDIIEKDAVINVYPYGTITKGRAGTELIDFGSIKDDVIAFSDDGSGIQTTELMCLAMLEAKKHGKIIAAHCEDNSLLFGGCIHDGEFARKNGFKGICSESEYGQIERDLMLAEETGCSYHVCHISTKESVELIRAAKKKGIDVTCETGPHYLTMDDSMLQNEGRFKMNPPLRSKKDRAALIEGIADGTIDMLATDHAPHSADEKSKGLIGSPFGIVGLETAFSVMYTKLVKENIIDLKRLIEIMAINPRKRFNIPLGNSFCVWDLEKQYTVNPDAWLSLGRSSPYIGERLLGECVLTMCDGKIAWNKEK